MAAATPSRGHVPFIGMQPPALCCATIVTTSPRRRTWQRMFFNTIWLYGSLILLIYGMATRQPSLTVLATLLLLTAGISWLWSRWSLRAVSYRRKLEHDAASSATRRSPSNSN